MKHRILIQHDKLDKFVASTLSCAISVGVARNNWPAKNENRESYVFANVWIFF